MAPKARYVDLKLSGRKLLAPPEGYTPRSEARIKRWLTQIPVVPGAPPDGDQSDACHQVWTRGVLGSSGCCVAHQV